MMSDNGQRGKEQAGAVMVVGGGISGMQSAIDLVNSGFKVYLVEETSSIGGRMAQLDKTFPTNDCSMCMISPKLIEVGKNLNIDILTNSRIVSAEGEEGDFKVKVLKTPRYIDEQKCSGCGDCRRRCPVGALGPGGEFDRFRCKERLDQVAAAYTGLGRADACGKCVCGTCGVLDPGPTPGG
jgi:heterodisulfide reductase subunit A-like polyferredoxin